MRPGLIWSACWLVLMGKAQGAERVLHSFGSPLRGAAPVAGLILDSDGNLYGTTPEGGKSGLGVVYKVDPGGNETVLHSFSGPDGANPQSAVTRDQAGNFFGTTINGGASGYGTVFKLDANGSDTVLYSFTGGTDGANPYAGVIRDVHGNLYGTTETGAHGGVVYKLDTSGHETVLHTSPGARTGLCRTRA